MQTIKHISICNPCSQNWQQMTPNPNGRHCANCCKTVTDFTRMSDEQIIATLSAGSKICGRFGPDQLNNINRKFLTGNLKIAGWWKRLAVAATVLWSITYFKTPAIGKPQVSSHPVKKDGQPGLAPADTTRYITITGVVTTQDDSLPLPGVTITTIGAAAHAMSNVNGSFKLQVPAGAKKISFSFVGYNRIEVAIDKKKGYTYHIAMTTSSALLGDVVIVPVTTPFADNSFNRSYGNQ